MTPLQLAQALDKGIGANSEAAEIPGWLDLGYPPLNEILSGDPDNGLPYGRIVEIFGPPSAGKTALACAVMQAAQRAGGVAGFGDHEHALDVALAEKNGLNLPPPYWIYKRPATWEESNTIAMRAAQIIRESKAIPPEAPIVWVMDSVASMIPRSMLFDSKGKPRELDELGMNDTTALARVSSTTLKIINKVCSDLNVIMLYLNQVRTKPGVMYGDPTTTPGGSAFEFYASIRLALGRSLVQEGEGKERETTGQIIKMTTKKNKVNRPFQEVKLLLTFPEGGGAEFDYVTSLLGVLMEQGKLTTANRGSKGKHVVWADGTEYPLKGFVEKAKAEGLYPKMVELYKQPAVLPAAASSAAATAAAAVAEL